MIVISITYEQPGDGGWPYLNSITSGQYFLLNALLYQYTGEASYLAWAQDTYDWLKYTANLTTAYHVYDGSEHLTCRQTCQFPLILSVTAPECTQGEGGSREFTYLSGEHVFRRRLISSRTRWRDCCHV